MCGAGYPAFSSGRERDCASVLLAGRIPAVAKNPWQQLPIAARPAMLASGGDVVARGKFFNDLDICDQTGACKDSLEQIVTEEALLSGIL